MSADWEKKYYWLKIVRAQSGVVELILDDPQRRNAIGEAGHAELATIWGDLNSDPTVRSVLVRGEGKAFSGGGTMDMLDRMAEDFETRVRIMHEARDIVIGLLDCAVPVVSAVRGPAAGAGLAVALLADISVVAEDAVLLDGHTRLGVAPGDHAALVWPLMCGMAKAKYYLLLNDRLTGREAERLGLASVCVPDAEVLDTGMDIAVRLAHGSSTAMRWTRQSLNGWWRSMLPTFDASLGFEFLGFGGPDAREGIAAVREKRTAQFASGLSNE